MKLCYGNLITFMSYRDGRLKIGDELINVNGKRLRGLEIDDAIRTLKQNDRELDIVISRDISNNNKFIFY